MPRMYTAVFSSVAVTAQQDLFEVLAATGKVCVIHELFLTQSTEVGDAQEEGLVLLMKRGIGAVTSGSGGTAPTPSPRDAADTAAGATTEVNNTTKMVVGSGSIQTLQSWNWNVRVPFQVIFTPETRPIITPGNRLTVELGTTPADSITMSGVITFEEIGG